MKSLSRYVSLAAGGEARTWSARVVAKALADATGRLVTFAVMVAAARVLEPAAFGVLAVASTAGWLLGVATDAGWGMHLARAIARHPDQWASTAREALERRIAGAVAAQAAVILAVPALVPDTFRWAFAVIVAAQLASAVLETAMHVVRGLERIEYESAIQGGVRVTTGVLAFAALAWRADVTTLAAALALPPLGGLVALAWLARRLARRAPPRAHTAPTARGAMPHQVLPLGLGALVSALYFRCDVFLVEHWHGLETAGAYSAVFRLVDAARLLPAAVLAVSFPRLVRATRGTDVRRLSAALGVTGVVVATGLAALAAPIVTATYGARYADAAGVLRVLAPALPLFYVNYALTHQVIGWDGQRAYLWTSVAALVANLALNVTLVPGAGARGAAAATVVTELVVTAGCLVALRLPRLAVAEAVAGEPAV